MANTAVVETSPGEQASNGNVKELTLTIKDTVSNTDVTSYVVYVKDGVII